MLLKELSEVCGGAGRETLVRDRIRCAVEERHDAGQISTDALGNLIVRKAGPDERLRVMVEAHMDEVALMITGIKDSGVLEFARVGAIDPRVLPAKRVSVGPGKAAGVIGSKPIHLQKREEQQRPIPVESLYIDIGASSRSQAEELVELGDYAYFTTAYESIGVGKWKGKALDDRVGCALLLEALNETYRYDFYGVFTVQEEIGGSGAVTAAYAVEPHIAVVLEGTTASDISGIAEPRQATRLGRGPALTFMDQSAITDTRLVQRLVSLADQHGIPYQFRETTRGGTDAGRIQRAREGCRVVVLSVPCRYIHSPVSVLCEDDLMHTAKLLQLFLKSLEEEAE